MNGYTIILTAHELLTVSHPNPHGSFFNFVPKDPSVLQHCLVDYSLDSMKNSAQLRRLSAREYWEKARKIMRTNTKIKLREQRGRRAKYSGPGAVAVVENVQRRLRAIRKWKNPALRYCELWLGNTNAQCMEASRRVA